MLDAKLVVVGGQTDSSEIELCLPLVIGRGNEADLAISDALVSRRHAEVFEVDGILFVRDLGSLNGTFVDNHRIVDAEPLLPQQLLTLGTITFRAIYSPVPVEALASQELSKGVSLDTVEFKSGLNDTVRLGEALSVSNGRVNQRLMTESATSSNAETTDLDAFLRDVNDEKMLQLADVSDPENRADAFVDHERESLSDLRRIPR
jgi:pSer/pThr/pTyr-binding forkhead associated (FHA) protein